jgi:vacuolar-type H+-ATPase subunit I/STV1
MDEQQQTPSTGTTGPITIEDVREAIGETDPHQTNAGTIRRTLGRGSLSTIQKHLEALRRQQRAAEAGVADQDDVIAPEAPNGLMRGLWEAAYGLALATVQNRLIAAQERAAELEGIRQAQCEEIEAMAELVDQAEAERDQIRAEAKAAREAQAKAEAERDDALKLRDQIASLMAKIDAITPAA